VYFYSIKKSPVEKTDYKRKYKEFYKPGDKEAVIVNIPSFNFLTIDGCDARPESKDFQEAIQALFTLSYKIKFESKKKYNKDYVVMPLEGLWWADDMQAFVNGQKEDWKWTLMIMQPEFISLADLKTATSLSKEKVASSTLEKIKLRSFEEGRSAQILHIGPFSEEARSINKIHELIAEIKGSFNGKMNKHHEIYLSDFRKVDPLKMRTIIRQPFVG